MREGETASDMTGPDETVTARPRKGRGAVTNRTGRFEPETRAAVDDDWPGDGEPPPPLRTTLSVDTARRVITYNKSPDIPFDRSINPYRGCEHGCVYCFARPTHAYYGLSPGLDFETRLFYKPDAAALLRRELRETGYRPATIAMGTNTDPYQPVERETGLTRAILQVLQEYRHPVSIVTKSTLILRDVDILADMARQRMASVCISVTTLDRRLARLMEPRAPTPARRLETIETLNAAGVPTGALVAPIIPALNDMEIDRIVAALAAAGAVSAGYVLLRLPLEIKDLFEEWLGTHYPKRKNHVMSLIRQTRDGAAYRAEWGARMRGTGPYADLIKQRFVLALRRHGLVRRSLDLDVSSFRPPPAPGDQLSLL
jgi:DNA repair photolyase